MRLFLICLFLGISSFLLGQTLTYSVEEKGLKLSDTQIVSLRNTVKYKLKDCLDQVENGYAKASISPVVISVQPSPYLGASGTLLSFEAHVSFEDFKSRDIASAVKLVSRGIGRTYDEALNSAISKLVINNEECEQALRIVSVKAMNGDSLAEVLSTCNEYISEARDLVVLKDYETAWNSLRSKAGTIPANCIEDLDKIQVLIEAGIKESCPIYVGQIRSSFKSGDSYLLSQALSRERILDEYCSDSLLELHQSLLDTQSENEDWNRKKEEVQLEFQTRGSSMDQVISLIRSYFGH